MVSRLRIPSSVPSDDDDPREIQPRERWQGRALDLALEGIVALSQGALAVVLGALARSLGGASQAAPIGTAMTWMSRLGLGATSMVTSPTTLAVTGLVLVTVRGATSIALSAREVRAGATSAGAARRALLVAALSASVVRSGGKGGVSLGAAVTWPSAIEQGARAERARRRGLVQLVVLAVVALLVDPALALLVVVALAPFALLLRPVRGALRSMHRRAAEGAVDTVDAVRDVVEHASLWATCGAEQTALRRVSALNDEGGALSVRAAIGQSAASTSNEILAAIAIVVLVAAFSPNRPTLVPILVALVSTYRPLRDVAESSAARARGAIAKKELAAIARASTAHARSLDRAWPKASLRLERLTLEVGGDDVRRGLDLEAHPGEPVAIVGAPGVGKSALLEAIVGVGRLASGTITYGDVSLEGRAIGPKFRPIAWVPPAPPVLPGSLAENLSPDAPNDRARIARARGVLAELGDEALCALDDDAPLGARGRRPSSGEAQRIALARALSSDARVLLLDEPTASLDAEGEARAVATIARHCVDRVLVFVTHRAAPLSIAAQIVTLSFGPPDGSRGDVVGATKSERRVA